MNLRRILIRAYLYGPYGFRKITGTGAFGHNRAEYVHGLIQTDGNPLKAGLLKHHVKQFHESSCSVATVVSAINDVRDEQSDKPVPISQKDILDRVKTAHWKERMSAEGYKGKRGLPLPVLGEAVQSSLDAYGLEYKAFETVQAEKNPARSKKIKDALLKRLHDFEKRGEISRVRPRRNQRQTSYRYSHNWKPGSKEAVKKDKIYRAMYVSTTFTVSDIQRLTDAPDRSHLDKTVKRLTDKGFLQVVGFRLCNHSIGKERLYHIVDRMRFKLEVQR